MTFDQKEPRIRLNRADAADRIAELEQSVDYCQQELDALLETYQLPSLSVPQVFQAKRHLRIAVDHLNCAADLAAIGWCLNSRIRCNSCH